MMEYVSEIIIALFGLIGTLYASWMAHAAKRRETLAQSELKFQQAALDFGAFLEEWDGTMRELEKLFEETPIDRFLIMRAWNGHLTPKWTTAIFQMRELGQRPVSYVHFELDTDYVSRLREISIRQNIHFVTSDIPDSAIKRVYEAEGVKSAVWCHLASHVTSGGARAITYCSFATHSDEPLSETVITRCTILAGRLTGLSKAFDAKKRGELGRRL